MKKLMLMLAMLAMVALAAVPAIAQDGGDANLSQEQNNAAEGGDSVAAAGNNANLQNQAASNEAATEVGQGQVAGGEQNAASEGGGDIEQLFATVFGTQSADVTNEQANAQEQSNTQTATGNTATADSSAEANPTQTGAAVGGAGGDQYGGAGGDQYGDDATE